jgi:cytochrome P450
MAIYGKNVATTVGDEWRLHRKITSRVFSQKNNQLVHSETTRQTLQMMESWERESHDGSVVIEK